MPEPSRQRTWLDHAVTALVIVAVWGVLLHYYKPSLLLLDTMDAGGDTPSFLRPIHHLKDVLLPAGNPQGWDLGNFAGYPPYQFYFLPPSLAIVLASYVIPLNVAFKLATVLGVFLLPLTTALALRGLRFAFPLPAIGAASTLLFLFNETNSMWGGNIKSTLAGEFAFSISFALAVLFVGLLWRGVERQKGWRSLGALLAVTGLCHPIGFLNAASAGIFFLFRRRTAARDLRYLILVYGVAVLLMGFWLVPLIAKIQYATAINWPWIFQSITELFPPILYPVFALAALDAVWVLVRRREEDRRIRYILLLLLVTVVWYLNGTEVGLPEIRFVPFAYMLCIILALDFARRVLPLQVSPHVAAIALSAGVIVWAQSWVKEFPGWIKWNYEGVERKASWPLLKAIADSLHGDIHDPRIVYENSPLHDRFGSMRIFENLALLSGRATLEGVLLQTAVNSPFIYNIQSLVSKQGTGVIAGYPYPDMNVARATPRLELYNVRDFIALTPEVTKQLEEHPRWERTFRQDKYSVYRLKDADPHYVRVARFRPVPVETTSWKRDFHRWFRLDSLLDIPIVAADRVPDAERGRFTAPSASPTALPREPVPGAADCRIDERVDHMQIDFTTTCPGLPHIVSVAYFPNWHVEGASHVHLVAPALMLVFPDGPNVRLTYRRVFADWLGLALSLVGLAVCAAGRQRVALSEPTGALARAFTAAQPALVGAATVAVLGITAWHVIHQYGPQYIYKRGWAAFTANDYPRAQGLFEQVLALGGESYTVQEAAFFRAASLLRAGKVAEGKDAYEEMLRRFPDSILAPEATYHVGYCLRQQGHRAEAARQYQSVIDTWPGHRWAAIAAEQIAQMKAEPGGLGG
jgi:hypothetical protein